MWRKSISNCHTKRIVEHMVSCFVSWDLSSLFISAFASYCRLAFFKAAFELFEADYFVKADDDIYLRPGELFSG